MIIQMSSRDVGYPKTIKARYFGKTSTPKLLLKHGSRYWTHRPSLFPGAYYFLKAKYFPSLQLSNIYDHSPKPCTEPDIVDAKCWQVSRELEVDYRKSDKDLRYAHPSGNKSNLTTIRENEIFIFSTMLWKLCRTNYCIKYRVQ